MKKPVVTNVRPADENNQVVTVEGGSGSYRRSPCPGCPWKKENDGRFPAEAFRHSANTAYDMSDKKFGCHESGTEKPATCAGFLLHGAHHNMSVRIGRMHGKMNDVNDGGHDMHQSYRNMAVANGVDPEDPVLIPCRD